MNKHNDPKVIARARRGLKIEVQLSSNRLALFLALDEEVFPFTQGEARRLARRLIDMANTMENEVTP
jgi:hypothetical protein